MKQKVCKDCAITNSKRNHWPLEQNIILSDSKIGREIKNRGLNNHHLRLFLKLNRSLLQQG